MSALVRLSALRGLRNTIHTAYRQTRAISTSPKNSETEPISPTTPIDTTKLDAELKKNWMSYGFETKDEYQDRSQTKASFFFTITLCIVWGSFIYAYLPDYRLRDWAQREAFLEIRRREALGLDHIDKNYIDPATMELPSDEELGDTEIII
ncbi:NADH dehydrogenase [ubiquinone] 1 beta subcomplex subunit 11, mitochondrial [Lutzomyia longipalpis]|uniref:NADH dehydrogenase [ubiquinone] 1 beta subcomplex subunit 11, mitochondrial n=1 Tax=Lutzomyia longipalpis TaxID=7200 RepID=A0A1B0CV98_LUTLO|nr:NADH dehydrogenase [ubiquinone] 1 beta subcomplex subunit 11, mitochondrial [Lutzomyia longipalpis]